MAVQAMQGGNTIDPRLNWAQVYNRFGIANGTVFAAVVLHSDVAKYDYCVAIDAFKWKIEHNDAPYNPPASQAAPITSPQPQPAQVAVVPDPAVQPVVPTFIPPLQPNVPQVVAPMQNDPPPPQVDLSGIPRARHGYPQELDTHAPSYVILKKAETQTMLDTRNTRFQKWYGSAIRPSMTRPDVDIGGNYCSVFWYLTLEWSPQRRATWLYHNSETIRPDVYRKEVEDLEVSKIVQQLKDQHTKFNPLYVDYQFASDPDLMFNSEYVDAVFHHDNKDTWSIPWGWLTLFVGIGGAVVVWWASTYDGVDLQIPWPYIVVLSLGALICVFMALR